jgi:Sulfotransferase domain
MFKILRPLVSAARGVRVAEEQFSSAGRCVVDHAIGALPSAKVFCIGRGKTGTTSLEAFFRGLNFQLGDQAVGELLIRDWAVRNFDPIIAFSRSAQVFQDVPFSLPFTFIALDMAFPGSKFILSVRDDAEQWYRSLTRFHTNAVGKGRLPTADDLKEYPYRHKGWVFEALQLNYGISENEPYEKQRLINAYASHNETIVNYFRYRPESLLTVNLSDAQAAKKIMNFVDMPYTGQTMPYLNRGRL